MALVLFICLLIAGRILDELSWFGIVNSVVLVVVYLVAADLMKWPPGFLTVVLGVMDVGLFLMIFKGDITIR